MPVTSNKTRRDAKPKRPASAALSAPDEIPSARIQRVTRFAHSRERAEDYVEAIAELIASCGEARTTDIAQTLGVSHVTVVRTVQRLKREGLVSSKPYRSIFLTQSGRRLAVRAKARHEKVVAFLEALGVSPAAAREDAEGIEHHVSEETLAAFERFVKSRSGRRTRNFNSGRHHSIDTEA
jgi:DtxR family manganese transport transcriptional regulator